MKLLFLALVAVQASFAWAQVRQPTTYGIILNGGGNEFNNEYRYFDNVGKLYSTYVEQGIPKKNIYTLYASGNTTTMDTLKRETTIKDLLNGRPNLNFNGVTELQKQGVPVNGSASKADLKKAFLDVAKKAKPGDLVSLYVTDHGTPEGEVVMWGDHEVPAAERTTKDKEWMRKNPDRVLKKTDTLSVEEIKEILKLLPKGVTVQIANNICYGGKLLELTDPDSDICVVSLEGPNKAVTSGVEKSHFVERYTKNLKDKNFYDSYLDAKNNDFQGNIGSWNSMDYFINNELKKNKNGGKAPVCSARDLPDAAKTESQNIVRETQIAEVDLRLTKMKKDLADADRAQKKYKETKYPLARKALTDIHEKIFRMPAGKAKDQAYKEYNTKMDQLQLEDDWYDQRIVNLRGSVKSIENEMLFLKSANPEQQAKYEKIKKCLQRSL